MKIVSSSICEVGRVRMINQDAVYSFCTDAWAVFAVADGMGGHKDGERASQEVVNTLSFWMKQKPQLEQMETKEIIRIMKGLLSESNNRIRSETKTGELCGCTVVLMVLVRQECILVTAGDSRCYELRNDLFHKTLIQLSEDDVIGGKGKQRERLTNALGIRDTMAFRSKVIPFKGKHTYLLCSDGVYKYCDEEKISSVLKKVHWQNTEECLRELQDYVEAGGARDNYSAIIIRGRD